MQLATSTQAERLREPLPLADLADVAMGNAQRCEDHAGVPLRPTRMRLDGSWLFNGTVATLSRHALSQLCARLELPGGGTVPAGYLSRCPSPLAAEHLNHWLSQPDREGQRVLIRTRKDGGCRLPTVRAVLAERYAPVDHAPLLSALRDLASQYDLGVQSWSLDNEQLILRLLVRGDHPASLDDPLRLGLQVSNSEVGLGKVSISAFITRLVCTNGLVIRVADLGGIHRRHVGRAGESLEPVIRAGIPEVLKEAEQAALRLVRLREQPAPQPMEAFLKRTAKEAELPESLVPRLAELLEGETLYDVINVFTRAAQSFPVAERVRIETAMSRFLQDGGNWN
jgi:hypothetical protein